MTARGAGGAEGIPASVLCVPCGEFGAMELADKRGGPFTIDDVEVVTILADVAAAALSRTGPLAPGPDELALRLRSMAASDPERYATVAPAVAALLAGL